MKNLFFHCNLQHICYFKTEKPLKTNCFLQFQYWNVKKQLFFHTSSVSKSQICCKLQWKINLFMKSSFFLFFYGKVSRLDHHLWSSEPIWAPGPKTMKMDGKPRFSYRISNFPIVSCFFNNEILDIAACIGHCFKTPRAMSALPVNLITMIWLILLIPNSKSINSLLFWYLNYIQLHYFNISLSTILTHSAADRS